MNNPVAIRPATRFDDESLWQILEPVMRAGETYPEPRDISREDALAYWHAPDHRVLVTEEAGKIVGSYYLRANKRGGGGHIANCGYVVAPSARRRGIGRMMCLHSLDHARGHGYRAMQFNFVVSSNEGAVKLWQSCGFAVVGTLPEAFAHPTFGLVDVYVMHRRL